MMDVPVLLRMHGELSDAKWRTAQDGRTEYLLFVHYHDIGIK